MEVRQLARFQLSIGLRAHTCSIFNNKNRGLSCMEWSRKLMSLWLGFGTRKARQHRETVAKASNVEEALVEDDRGRITVVEWWVDLWWNALFWLLKIEIDSCRWCLFPYVWEVGASMLGCVHGWRVMLVDGDRWSSRVGREINWGSE